MKTRNILISSISTFIFGITITSGSILAHTNANVDKVELLTRAVQQDNLKNLQRKRGDINIQSGEFNSGAIIGNSLYMWGNNDYGQLGTRDTTNRNVPTRINLPDGTLTELAVGTYHTGVIISNNAYTWGRNNFGQLGNGTTVDSLNPILVLSGASSLALGVTHSGAIVGGNIYMWGENQWGQLGDDTFDDRATPAIVYDGNIKGMYARDLAVGLYHSGAILTDPKNGDIRKLYAWGYNKFGQLGYSSSIYNYWEYPKEVKDINKKGSVSSISFGGWNSTAIVGGKLYAWGSNEFGQLGIGYTSSWKWATEVPISNVRTVKVSSRSDTIVAINDLNNLYIWGRYVAPWIVLDPKIIASNVSQVGLGEHHLSAVIDGKIYTRGNNNYGQLGQGTTPNSAFDDVMKIVNINEDFIINLNSIDPKVVYNYTDDNLKAIINQNYDNTGMNLPEPYDLSSTIKVGSVAGGNGRVIARIDEAFPITTNITINGFLPVKETALTKISPISIPENDTTFELDTLGSLIEDANNAITGQDSKLVKWIIANSSMIIGNYNTYTQDFPKGAVITKADGFVVSPLSSDDIEFNIHVNKYYEKSGDNLVLSTSSTPVKIVQKVVLSGLQNVVSYGDCIDPETGVIAILETQINPQTDANKFFEAITGDAEGGRVINRLLLGQYINTRFIPADAEVTLVRDKSIIQDPNTLDQTVAFTLTTNKYFLNGVLVTHSSHPLNEYLTFLITTQQSSISVKNDIDAITSIVTTGDALDEILVDKLIFNKDSSKYFDFTNFPLNTVFTLERVINNFNEDGILELSIKADNYYEITSLNPMYQSKLFPVAIKGFKPSHDIDVYPVVTSQNQKIELDLTKDQFYNQIIVDNIPNRAFIGQYIDLRAIPTDANLSITKMQYNDDGTIILSIKSDKYYNDGGTTINQTYEATVLVVLPMAIDLTLIISLSAGGAFLIFLIVCIILTIRNKQKLKSK